MGKATTELAPRERQVMGLLAEGYTLNEIADQLNKSPNTIQTYVQRVKVKLAARNTLHAAVLFATRCSRGDAEYLSWARQ